MGQKRIRTDLKESKNFATKGTRLQWGQLLFSYEQIKNYAKHFPFFGKYLK